MEHVPEHSSSNENFQHDESQENAGLTLFEFTMLIFISDTDGQEIGTKQVCKVQRASPGLTIIVEEKACVRGIQYIFFQLQKSSAAPVKRVYFSTFFLASYLL